METPLRRRSGGHIGTAPTVSFEQIACGTVDFVWVDCVWMSALTHFVWEVIFANVATRVCEWMCGGIKPVGLVLLSAQGCRR